MPRRLAFRIAFCVLQLGLPIGAALLSNTASAASSTIRDAASLQLGDITYRLDGIDAPAIDQTCIDDHADGWACGIETRDQLNRLIDNRAINCKDLGPDASSRKRRLGLCTVEGDDTSLNQRLVRLGFALATAERFKADETGARDQARGLWKGCLIAPSEFRRGKKDAALLGASCRSDRDKEIREALFPSEPVMPPTCSIKAKFSARARITGNIGIYHLQACRTYPAVTNPDRWFCSEDDARAEGFRKAINCRAPRKVM